MATEKDLVDRFLQASAVAEQSRLHAAQRRARLIISGLVLVLVVVSGLGLYANARRLEVERQRRITLARQLSAQAITAVDRKLDAELSLLLAVEAAKFYQSLSLRPDMQADEALRRALSFAPQTIVRYDQAHEPDPASVDLNPLASIKFSPSGKYLLVTNVCDTTCIPIRVIDVGTGVEVATLDIAFEGNLIAKFNPGEDKLAVMGSEGVVCVLRIPTGETLTKTETKMATSSADGTFLGRITANGEVRLLNLATPENREVVLPHTAGARFIAFDPLGERLVSIDMKGDLHLWVLANSSESIVFRNDIDFSFAAFSPDGQMLAAVGSDKLKRSGYFYLWNTHTGEKIASHSYESEVGCVEFSSTGQWIAVEEELGRVHLWDTSEMTMTRSYDGKLFFGCDAGREAEPFRREAEAFSPDGRRIIIDKGKAIEGFESATGIETGNTIGLFDSVTGEEVTSFSPVYGLEVITFVRFSLDSSRLALVSNEDVMRPGTLYLWDAATGKLVSTMPHVGWIIDLEISPDGRQIATIGSSDPEWIKPGPVYVWDFSTGELMNVIRHTHIGSVSDLEFSRDGTKLATVGADNTVRIWDLLTRRNQLGMYYDAPTAEELTELQSPPMQAEIDSNSVYVQLTEGSQIVLPHEKPVTDFYFSDDYTRIATVTGDRRVHLWDVTKDKMLTTFSFVSALSDDYSVTEMDGIRFSMNGERLVINVFGSYASVWDIQSNRELAAFAQDEAAMIDSMLSPDGARLVMLAGTGFIRRGTRSATLWDVDNSRKIARVNGATVAEFSPDTTLLATGGMDGTVRVLDAYTGDLVRSLSHEGEVEALDFSPDGTLLATGSKDRTARIWDVASGVEVAILNHDADVEFVVFSSDGTQLFTRDSTDKVYKWSVNMDALTALACEILTRNFTQQEWETYVGGQEPYHETCPDVTEDQKE